MSDASAGDITPAPNGEGVFSPNGRYVLYSEKRDVQGAPTSWFADLYLADRQASTVTQVNRTTAGSVFDGAARPIAVTSSGRYILFVSNSTSSPTPGSTTSGLPAGRRTARRRPPTAVHRSC